MPEVRLFCVNKSRMLITSGIIFMLLFAMSLLLTEQASAHGNVTNSRAGLCESNVNKNCGLIIYEPYSLEAHKGFPAGGHPSVFPAAKPRFVGEVITLMSG
ncbi:hypothetical protein ACQKI4_28745, partial [Paenibacillus glucanolyticus]